MNIMKNIIKRVFLITLLFTMNVTITNASQDYANNNELVKIRNEHSNGKLLKKGLYKQSVEFYDIGTCYIEIYEKYCYICILGKNGISKIKTLEYGRFYYNVSKEYVYGYYDNTLKTVWGVSKNYKYLYDIEVYSNISYEYIENQ